MSIALQLRNFKGTRRMFAATRYICIMTVQSRVMKQYYFTA